MENSIMKLLRLILALIVLAPAPQAFSQAETPSASGPNMTAVFNALYPDLASHQDVVTAAMMSLTAEGFQGQTLSVVMEATATRARTNLQRAKQNAAPLSAADAATFNQRQNASREEAQRLFPEVADPSSALCRRVIQERAKLDRVYPEYFKNPDWPMMLTNGCMASMILESQERKAQQQTQATQGEMSVDQAKEAVELLQMLQYLKNSRGQAR